MQNLNPLELRDIYEARISQVRQQAVIFVSFDTGRQRNNIGGELVMNYILFDHWLQVCDWERIAQGLLCNV